MQYQKFDTIVEIRSNLMVLISFFILSILLFSIAVTLTKEIKNPEF